MKLLRMICGWLTKPSELYMDKNGEYFTASAVKSENLFYWTVYRQDWAGQWFSLNAPDVTEHDKRKYAEKV